ncbi:hypothetical protein ABZ178_18290 [Streptomyces massasporeus]
MRGEPLVSAVVLRTGLSGDRTHAVLDETGAIGSAKHPRKWGPLLGCRSRVAEDDTVEVELPDGRSTREVSRMPCERRRPWTTPERRSRSARSRQERSSTSAGSTWSPPLR